MRVVNNSLIYMAVSVLQATLGFLLLPVYTSCLTASDYGIANVVTSVVSFLSILYLLALHGAGTRFQYKYQSDETKTREIWGTLFIFVTANAVAMSLVLFVFRDLLLKPFLAGIPFYPFMFLGLLGVAFSPAYALFQANLQARQLGRRYGLNNLAYFVINAGLTLLFLTVFEMKAEGILLALAVTNAAFFCYTLVVFLPEVRLRFRRTHFRESFLYSLPLVPHSMAGWIMSLVDRLFLNYYKSTAAVGIFSAGYQIGNLINILTSSINQAYVPWFFEKFEQGEMGRKRIARLSEVMVLCYSLCALVTSLFARELLTVMVTHEYREGWTIVPLISFSFVFTGVYYIFVNPLFVRRTSLVPVITVASAGIGVALNVTLIPRYGIIGAAAASFASMVASSVLALLLSSRFEHVGFNWIRIFAYASGAFLLSLAVLLRPYFGPVQFFLVKAGIVVTAATYFYSLYQEEVRGVFQFLTAGEWRRA